MGRFWGTATPASFESKADNPNVTLPNRNLAAALRFVEIISTYLVEFEAEMAAAVVAAEEAESGDGGGGGKRLKAAGRLVPT